MAIYYPDILEHNNSNYPLLDPTFLKGTAYPLASISTTGSIPADKRNVGMIVFDSGSGKFYGYKGSNVSNWATASNWIEFGSGSGAGETIQTGSFLYSGSYNSAASAITLYSKDTNYILDLSGLAGGGGGGFPITASNEGSDLTNSMTKIDFVGNAVTATNLGSIVTVTINTGSATTVDITPLNNFTGSAQTSINALNNFSGSANTRFDNLEAATGSYVTNAKTGSFYYSSSIDSNVITFNQGDGTTESITITAVTSASYAPNIYNSNGTLTGQRTITIPNNTTLRFTPTTDAIFQVNNQGGSIVLNGLPTGVSSSLLAINSATGYVTMMSTSSIQNVVSSSFASTASYAPNLYNSNGTLTGAREVNLGSNALKFNNSSAFFTVSGSDRVAFNNFAEVNTGYVVGYDLTGISGTQGYVGYVTASKLTVASASYAPNIYNTNGTLTGDRVITLGANNQLRIAPGTGESEFRISDGPTGGPFGYEVVVSGSGEFRVNSTISASFQTDVYVAPTKVLTLGPKHPLPTGVPTGSFAVSSSIPPRPYMWDGTSWYAL